MSSETILENSDATVKENDSNATVRERSDSGSSGRSIMADTYFRNYKIIRELPTKSTEADIFVVSKDGIEYILKKYRKGFDPKQEILQAIKVLSENYPDNLESLKARLIQIQKDITRFKSMHRKELFLILLRAARAIQIQRGLLYLLMLRLKSGKPYTIFMKTTSFIAM